MNYQDNSFKKKVQKPLECFKFNSNKESTTKENPQWQLTLLNYTKAPQNKEMWTIE